MEICTTLRKTSIFVVIFSLGLVLYVTSGGGRL